MENLIKMDDLGVTHIFGNAQFIFAIKMANLERLPAIAPGRYGVSSSKEPLVRMAEAEADGSPGRDPVLDNGDFFVSRFEVLSYITGKNRFWKKKGHQNSWNQFLLNYEEMSK